MDYRVDGSGCWACIEFTLRFWVLGAGLRIEIRGTLKIKCRLLWWLIAVARRTVLAPDYSVDPPKKKMEPLRVGRDTPKQIWVAILNDTE